MDRYQQTIADEAAKHTADVRLYGADGALIMNEVCVYKWKDNAVVRMQNLAKQRGMQNGEGHVSVVCNGVALFKHELF